MNVSQTGQVLLAEFVIAFSQAIKGTQEEKTVHCFRMFSTNGVSVHVDDVLVVLAALGNVSRAVANTSIIAPHGGNEQAYFDLFKRKSSLDEGVYLPHISTSDMHQTKEQVMAYFGSEQALTLDAMTSRTMERNELLSVYILMMRYFDLVYLPVARV